ncbi:PepSY-associated TM helix domain-containing protein [Desertivirga arenae]|uniref:PepSY-associated TM helix domain-containing protein n=1 Tax=Desertivirga arenae TaxID=2810309 RepID=UPI001A960D17|nr:PepSY-associated TM helix domain-containing protein [Pedobacter sp. SYSU D00823]
MRIKKLVGKLHLWLGLSSGLLVLFLGITGCILAFQQEIENASQSYRYLAKDHKALLTPSQIKTIAEAELPGKHAHSVKYQDGRNAVVTFYNSQPDYYYLVYVNPYSGNVLKVKDMSRDFFRVVIMGHYYLWLPPEIGQPIVATGTLIFVILLISGLILWWPKNAAARKKRFTLKLNAQWKRVNYDLHNVLGFYMTWVAIFIAITGLVMGFQWFSKSVYWISSGGKAMVQYYPALSDSTITKIDFKEKAEDVLWLKMQDDWKHQGGSFEVHFPENEKESIELAFNPDTETYWKTDYRFFDQKTLKEIEVTHLYGKFSKASTADKIMRMNYDIHVGAVWGLPGKILVFLASLLAASMPVTGFLIWRGRRKKSKATTGAKLLQTRKAKLKKSSSVVN